MVLFSEDHIQETKRRGRIEVICGSMFSGKTEELIRRLKRAKFAKQRVEIFKPAIDTRYSEADVVSHDSHSIASTPIDSSASILLFTSEIDVVGIDEAQFFDSGLIDVCNQLANNGIRVIVAGLPRYSIRPYAGTVCHCRRSFQSARHLCEMRTTRLFLPPHRQERQTSAAGRNRRIRAAMPGVLSASYSGRPKRRLTAGLSASNSR